MAILVVDGDTNTLDWVIERLQLAGFETFDTTDGEEAFRLLESNLGITFVFADAACGGPGGMDALAPLIRRRWPHIPVLPSGAVDAFLADVVPFARRRVRAVG